MKLQGVMMVLSVAAVGATVGLATSAASGQAPDAVALSPQMYKVRLENGYVRVLEYRSHPGEKEPMHSHRPGVVYYLSDYTVRVTDPTGHVTESSRKEGDVAWRGTTIHAAENVGTSDGHVLSVELKVALTAPEP